MGQPAAPEHHSRRLKVNHKALWKSVLRIGRRLWPLAPCAYLIQVFLNMQGDGEMKLLEDLVYALWLPLLLLAIMGPLLYGVLLAGTWLRMKLALQNPGPGKPPREPRRKL